MLFRKFFNCGRPLNNLERLPSYKRRFCQMPSLNSVTGFTLRRVRAVSCKVRDKLPKDRKSCHQIGCRIQISNYPSWNYRSRPCTLSHRRPRRWPCRYRWDRAWPAGWSADPLSLSGTDRIRNCPIRRLLPCLEQRLWLEKKNVVWSRSRILTSHIAVPASILGDTENLKYSCDLSMAQLRYECW